MIDIAEYRARWIVLFVLFTVPIFRMLLEHDYGFFYVEVLVVLLVFGGMAAGLAAIRRPAFHVLVVGSIVLLSVNTVQENFLPLVEARWIIAGITALLVCGMLVLRKHFYQILLIFILGSCLGDIANIVIEYAENRSSVQAKGRNYEHVVHIILDEMIGLGAMPPECSECVEAGAALQQSLKRGNFQIYPFAFSNYRATRDSIPSILNGHILGHAEEYLPTDSVTRPFLHANRYFDAYLAKKYAIRVYQSDYILFDSPEYASVRARTYKATNLKALHSMHAGWRKRLKQILVVYIRSDRFWSRLWDQLVGSPLEAQGVGPLAAQNVWPDRLFDDFRTATENTLFFVHLLSPHSPYVYRSDGSIKDLSDVNSPNNHCGWCWETAMYRQGYRSYGEQVQFLAAQIDAFLERLKRTGLYDSTTIIIHGDHGSRLRLLTSSSEQLERTKKETVGFSWVNRYDYAQEPELRDLVNRFATLLAIKLPGSRSSKVVTETGSVLYFLEHAFGRWGEPIEYDEVNSVYLFNADGSPRRIPMAAAWQKARQQSLNVGNEQ